MFNRYIYHANYVKYNKIKNEAAAGSAAAYRRYCMRLCSPYLASGIWYPIPRQLTFILYIIEFPVEAWKYYVVEADT
jgi:hypothetical protein